jgi:tRNA(Arg) A34 adenosine deaminase TadA
MPAMLDDKSSMALALDEAREAAGHGDVPIGCVITRGGEVIARAHNARERDEDPTAHAEVLALRAAAAALGSWRLDGCSAYVTLEPCVMCAGAMVLARVERLVYAAQDPKAGAVRSLYNIADDARLNHRIAVTAGVLEDEAAELLRTYFSAKRP